MAQESNRIRDRNGYLLVRGCPISREGIFEYTARQCNLPGDPNRKVNVYRPKEAVSDPDFIESIRNIPIINDHEMMNGIGGLHPEYKPPEDVGVDGVTTSEVYYDDSDGWAKADLKVFSRALQEEIEIKKKTDLSLGFSSRFIPKEGSFDGKEYECIQTYMRGNHLGVVDEARVQGAKVLDSLCFDSLTFDETKIEHINEDSNMKPEEQGAVSELQKLAAMLSDVAERAKNGEFGTKPSSDGEVDKPSDGDVSNPEKSNEDADEDKNNPGEVSKETAERLDDDKKAPVESIEVSEDEDDPDGNHDAGNPDDVKTATGGDDDKAYGLEKPEDIQVFIEAAETLISQIKDLVTAAPSADRKTKDENTTETEDGTPPCVKPTVDEDGEEMNEQATEDSAIKKFYRDNKIKANMYDRLSNVVGAFDCATMDSKDVAAYGVKKLGLKCSKGTEHLVLNAYLDGVAEGQKSAVKEVATTDSTRNSDPDLIKYLNEVK